MPQRVRITVTYNEQTYTYASLGCHLEIAAVACRWHCVAPCQPLATQTTKLKNLATVSAGTYAWKMVRASPLLSVTKRR